MPITFIRKSAPAPDPGSLDIDSMQFFPTGSAACEFASAKLLLPGVTSANVGQLAIDLIISTLHLPCVGQLETPCLLPCAGIGAFDHLSQRISLSLELFECPVAQGPPVFVLQQRAPAARGCQQKYAEELARWISEAAFAEVVLIASLDANLRQDRQIAGHKINYISSGSTAAACQKLGWEQLEGGLMADLGQQQSVLPPWTLIEAFRHSSIAYTCIVVFAAEGNNAPDAMRVADAVNQYLDLLIQQQPQPNGKHHPSKGVVSLPSPWLAPLSWKYVYGPASSRGLY
ncbi:TPA: hypothetical protein ACH3X1_002259 [Trebouxia sp. C0004]